MTLIGLLLFGFIIKKTDCPKIEIVEAEEDSEIVVHWTLGVDYSKLTEIKDNDLNKFVKKIEQIVSTNNWNEFINNCAPDHYEIQFEELDFSKSRYILNNLMVYSTYKKNLKIINQLPEIDSQDEFYSLNSIKKMSIIGINEDDKYEGIISLCGYLELKDNNIKAVNIWVTKRNGKYEITGAVG
ncbi:hypothetical protein A8C32_13545 [Flavivirga aquatica]|uniref:Uncharacterized protein n=1 Tax=Flavivirga aquatica TaxID=1849968 RepID=A0A1E5TC61_9FLAO|nr:hypothetical protein [Flavivirga aquatica]OEK08929.1 hypothetical protein A8C32_13545 [Flavivirga aquatica]